MVYQYNGPYSFSKNVIEGWDSIAIGVYYCGYINANNQFCVLYVGRAVGEGGIRGRLLQHFGENKWLRVTHFSYKECTSAQAAINHEADEIQRLQPIYNIQRKYSYG